RLRTRPLGVTTAPATRNKRDVWTISPDRQPDHPAPMPTALAETCIRVGCPPGGTVIDPFCGTGTTSLAAERLGRNSIGIDIDEAYASTARARVGALTGLPTDTTSSLPALHADV